MVRSIWRSRAKDVLPVSLQRLGVEMIPEEDQSARQDVDASSHRMGRAGSVRMLRVEVTCSFLGTKHQGVTKEDEAKLTLVQEVVGSEDFVNRAAKNIVPFVVMYYPDRHVIVSACQSIILANHMYHRLPIIPNESGNVLPPPSTVHGTSPLPYRSGLIASYGSGIVISTMPSLELSSLQSIVMGP